MAETNEVRFDDAPDTKPTRSINTAGVHRKFVIKELSYTKETEKDGKKVGPYVKIVFEGESGGSVLTFQCMVFQPPTKEEDVKFPGGVFEGGSEVRKRTPKEEIQAQFMEKFYLYQQIGMAWGVDKVKLEGFKKAAGGAPEVLFHKMYDTFTKAFPPEKFKEKPVDFKVMWNNNTTKKTSFLNLCKPSANNLVIGPHLPSQNSMVALSSFEEQRGATKLFTNADRAPSTNDPEVGGSTSSAVADAPSSANAAEEELF